MYDDDEQSPETRKTESYWISSSGGLPYPELVGETEVDVAVIGAGISGLTTALLLKQAGLRVAVVERSRVAMGESGHTTAHLTEIVDARYHRIQSKFGLEASRLVAQSSRAAIEKIAAICESLPDECGFKRVPAYLYAERRRDPLACLREVKAARRAGVAASWTTQVPLPFETHGALFVHNQAQFHPRRYLLGLAEMIQGDGSAVYEHSPVHEIREDDPCVVLAARGRIRAKSLVVTTNAPDSSPFLLQLKVAAYRTYAIAARVLLSPPPAGLYWDMEDPYHYTRQFNGLWIIGGEDHKTGEHSDTELRFNNLREFAASHFAATEVTQYWSGQILEPADGLPYIGLSPLSDRVYVATGYSGNGMTFGTVAGMLISDLILKRQNAWADLYRPSRIKPLSSGLTILTENKDYPLHMLKDRLPHRHTRSVAELLPGEASVLREGGQTVAAYREPDGTLHAVSAGCTHMGCHVQWNSAEKSWDCPCHGSRFDVDGIVMNGPAMKNLAPIKAAQKAPKEAQRRRKKRAA